jgi:lysophospholipase L1-like esterase
MDQDLTGPNVANDTLGYFIFTIDIWLPQSTGLIACIGDNITDGYLSSFDANLRYPDQLSDRLNSDASSSNYAVMNVGISSNRVLSDGGWGGQSLLTRMDHDLFSLNGLTHVVLLEGTNDIVFSTVAPPFVPARDLIQAYEQFIQALHIKGIAAIGATITPYKVPAGFNVSSS